MSEPLKVLTSVPLEAFPVIDALHRLHRDVGSVAARLALPGFEEDLGDLRLICVGCVDLDDVFKLSRDLANELKDDAASAALASKVAIIQQAMGLFVVAFIELPCVRAEEGEQPS